MLRNQDFTPPNRVALGYELFFDPRGVNKISMTRAAAFRRIANSRIAGMQYFLVADFNHSVPDLPPYDRFFNTCRNFGIPVADEYILPLPAAKEDMNALLILCDLIYAPSLMANRGMMRNDRSSLLPPDEFLRAFDKSLEGLDTFDMMRFRRAEAEVLAA